MGAGGWFGNGLPHFEIVQHFQVCTVNISRLSYNFQINLRFFVLDNCPKIRINRPLGLGAPGNLGLNVSPTRSKSMVALTSSKLAKAYLGIGQPRGIGKNEKGQYTFNMFV